MLNGSIVVCGETESFCRPDNKQLDELSLWYSETSSLPLAIVGIPHCKLIGNLISDTQLMTIIDIVVTPDLKLIRRDI